MSDLQVPPFTSSSLSSRPALDRDSHTQAGKELVASSSSLHEPVSVSATESAHLSRQGLLLLSEARAPCLTVWCPTHAERLSYQTGTAAQISMEWRKGS